MAPPSGAARGTEAGRSNDKGDDWDKERIRAKFNAEYELLKEFLGECVDDTELRKMALTNVRGVVAQSPRGPPLPPSADVSHQKRGPQPFTLDQAHQHVPAAVVKLLRAQLTPLAEDTLPEPADLEPFWDRTKRALLSLDQSFSETNLVMKCGGGAIANLGPLIIGAVGWQQIKGKHKTYWNRFTKAVEEAFGLTRQ